MPGPPTAENQNQNQIQQDYQNTPGYPPPPPPRR
jgi:hypothetical protein